MSEFDNTNEYPLDGENEYFLEEYCAVIFEFSSPKRSIFSDLREQDWLDHYFSRRIPRTKIINQRIESFKKHIFYVGKRTSKESIINKFSRLRSENEVIELNPDSERFTQRIYIIKTIHVSDFIEIISGKIDSNEILTIPAINKLLYYSRYEYMDNFEKHKSFLEAVANYFSFSYITVELKNLFEIN